MTKYAEIYQEIDKLFAKYQTEILKQIDQNYSPKSLSEYLREYRIHHPITEFSSWNNNINEIPAFIQYVTKEQMKEYNKILNLVIEVRRNIVDEVFRMQSKYKLPSNQLKPKKNVFKSLFNALIYSQKTTDLKFIEKANQLKSAKLRDLAGELFQTFEASNYPNYREERTSLKSKSFQLPKQLPLGKISRRNKFIIENDINKFKNAYKLDKIINDLEFSKKHPELYSLFPKLDNEINKLKNDIKLNFKLLRSNLEVSMYDKINLLIEDSIRSRISEIAIKSLNSLVFGNLEKMKKFKNIDKEELMIGIITGFVLNDFNSTIGISGNAQSIAKNSFSILSGNVDNISELITNKDQLETFILANKQELTKVFEKAAKLKTKTKEIEFSL